MDFAGYPDWMVMKAAERWIRTDGHVLLHPDEILKYPRGWERAVHQAIQMYFVAKPQEKKAADGDSA